MAVMAFIPPPCPSQGRMMCWHRWILPFSVELWVCLGNTSICWITLLSSPGSARMAPVPEALWKRSKAVMQVWNPMGSQEGEQGTEQPWADVQHFVLLISFGHSNSTGKTGQGTACRRVPGLPKSPEGTSWGCCQGRVYCPWGTQKYSSDWPLVDAHFSPDYLGRKCLLPPSISFSALLAFSCWDLI